MILRVVAYLLGLAAAAGLIVLGRLYFRQGKLIFRPGPILSHTPQDYKMPFEELKLLSPKGTPISAWWIPCKASDKVVIFFHGSDSNITCEIPTLWFLYSLRVNVLAVEYPGYGLDGSKASERGCYQAAWAAWNFLVETKKFSPESIILFGHSLGGAISVYLAAEKPCGGLVVQSSFTSVPDLAAKIYPYLPVRLFVHTKMNSLAKIDRIQCPLLILHSETDEHIPIEHARELFEKANPPKKFIAFYGPHFGNHWLRNPAIHRAWKELVAGETEAWQPSRELAYA
jgi:pimeloyl-ACP methyl ester carboxylesterase